MLTVLLSAKALLAFGSGNEVRVAYGLVDEELLPFGLRDSLGWGARQGGAFALLYQAGNPTNTVRHISLAQLKKDPATLW